MSRHLRCGTAEGGSALLMDHMGTTWVDQFSARLLDALLFSFPVLPGCPVVSVDFKAGYSFFWGGRILSFLDISSLGYMEASSKSAVLPRSLLIYILV